jgi:hypothetical protein
MSPELLKVNGTAAGGDIRNLTGKKFVEIALFTPATVQR